LNNFGTGTQTQIRLEDMKNPPLETARLVLRVYQEGDFEAFAALNGRPTVRARVGGPLARVEAERLFARFRQGPARSGIEAWGVILKDSEKYIGHAWLTATPGLRRGEVGFLISDQEWRKGYGSELARALVDYALGAGGYTCVMASVDSNHVASRRILEKLGMKRERLAYDEEGPYWVYSKPRG
jgi:ribosomal-protein-alanine N-acetyltransferase